MNKQKRFSVPSKVSDIFKTKPYWLGRFFGDGTQRADLLLRLVLRGKKLPLDKT